MHATVIWVIAAVLAGCSGEPSQSEPQAPAPTSYAPPRLADHRFVADPDVPGIKLDPAWRDLTMSGAPERDYDVAPLGCDEACVRARERLASSVGSADDHVLDAVGAFFGEMRGGYFVHDWTVARQVVAGLGVPDRVSGVAQGELMVSGCRPGSCGEKAAVIVRPSGEVLAAALISHRCKGRSAEEPACGDRRVLTVFVRPDGDSHRYRRVFKRWASVVSAPVGVGELVLVPAT